MEPESHDLLLPLIREENICLPLPINVVSSYWNVRLSMDEAAQAARRYHGFGGSILIEGIESAERRGLACVMVRSSVPELKRIIDAGVPPIVMLPGVPEITQHASVITGFDEGTIHHYVQEGTAHGDMQEGAIPQDVFDGEWSEEGRTALLIAPPDVLSSMRLENGPGDSNRLCLEAERHAILGDAAAAIALLREAIERDPGNSGAMYQLGALLSRQNSAECMRLYEKALETNPRSYLSRAGLGNFCLKTGRFQEAEDHYTKAIGINPRRSAKIYKNRAYLRERDGRNSDARDDLKSYLRCFPRAPDRGVIEQAIKEL